MKKVLLKDALWHKNTSVLYALILLCFSIMIPCCEVNALAKDGMENKKALGYGLFQCYSNGGLVKTIETEQVDSYKSLLNNEVGSGLELPMINGLYSDRGGISIDNVNCEQLLGGRDPEWKGLVNTGKTNLLSEKKSLLESLAYKSVGEGACVALRYYKYDETTFGNTNPNTQLSDGDFTDVSSICHSGGKLRNGSLTVSETKKDSFVKFKTIENGIEISIGGDLAQPLNSDDNNPKELSFGTDESFDAFIQRVRDAITGNGRAVPRGDYKCFVKSNQHGNNSNMESKEYQCFTLKDADSAVNEAGKKYTIGEDEDAWKKSSYEAMGKISALSLDMQNGDGLKFSDDEKKNLYSYYLKDYYGMEIGKDLDPNLSESAGYKKVSGNGTTCYATVKYHKDESVNALNGDNLFNNTKKKWEELVDELGAGVVCSIETSTSMPNESDENDIKEATCRNSKGAESFGWIVCPLITWLSNETNGFYDHFVEPALAVEPTLFNGGGNNEMDGVRKAWESFRDLANIAFIVLLLVVIFSQVTGVGIDNYGVKKILPKLIVAAVLINLSYLICLVLIDLSNILGNGLQQFFIELSKALDGNGQVTLTTADEFLFANGKNTTTIGDKIAGIGALGALAGVTGTVFWANPAIVLSLLIGAIGMVVSIFFLFILLSVRKALIVVLVAISSLAFVCYMLPNTKPLFDKWRKLFEGMLLVYPIAGLLMGAGDYVSRILFKSSNDVFMWITAVVVGVMPIFLLPMVVKGAFSAMGKIGGVLTGMGAGASKATQRQIKERGGEIAKKVGSTDTFRGIRNTIGMKSPISTKRMRARAVQDQAALMKERSARERLADKGNIDTRLASIASAEEAKAVDEATSQRLSLMQSSGSGGGIRLGRGIENDTERAVPFTPGNAAKRMEQLEQIARGRELDNDEQQELAALARGMADMSGGGSAMAGVIRGAKDGNGNVNSNFMKVMGQIYARDSSVQSKLNEKDAGAAAYTENFMPGGVGGSVGTFDDYKAGSYYKSEVDKRAKSYTAGLNQGGVALSEYVESLDEEDIQNIKNDDKFFNSLDKSAQKAINKRIEDDKIPVRPPRQVQIVGGNQYGAGSGRVAEPGVSGTGIVSSAGGLGGASGAGSASRDGESMQLDERRAPELKATNLGSESTRLGQIGGRNHDQNTGERNMNSEKMGLK